MSKRYKKKPKTPRPQAKAAPATVQQHAPQPAGSAIRQTRAQRMARIALDCVKHVAAGKLAKDYKPRAMSFSTMVLQSGLAQAVGFLAAKGAGSNDKDKAYKHYLEDVAKVCGHASGEALHDKAINTDLAAAYRLLTREVLDASSWLKRFSQTLLKDDDDKAPKESSHVS